VPEKKDPDGALDKVELEHLIKSFADRFFHWELKRNRSKFIEKYMGGPNSSIATEIMTNIYKYANFGLVMVRMILDDNKVYIEVRAVDKGPGIDNIPWALEYGTTTRQSIYRGKRSAGLGLHYAMARYANLAISSKGKTWRKEIGPTEGGYGSGTEILATSFDYFYPPDDTIAPQAQSVQTSDRIASRSALRAVRESEI